MAFLTKSEFATLCGLTPSNITTYVGRNKLVMTDDGMFLNDTDPINAAFITKRMTAEITKNVEEFGSTENYHFEQTKRPVGKGPSNTSIEAVQQLVALDTEIKLAHLEKVKVDTRINTIKEQKLLGDLIPVGLVMSVTAQGTHSLVHEFRNAADNIIVTISKRYGLSSADIADLRKMLTVEINDAVDRHVEANKKQITNLIDEFSVKKEVGERE